MKEIIQKISAVCMTLVVLFSTMSFTIDMHYCGTTLVDIALYKEAKTCGMKQQVSDKSTCSILLKKSCCSDKQLTIDGQDELQNSFDSLTFEQQVFISSFYYSFIDLFEGLEANIVPFKEHSPPFLVKDIHILNETFLI
ncbi:HYC_CC_PP family protein [Aquimarina aquimarini]|uniref:HYC_CC_PP family protein n=1 Tax=Aquimarina aquimarini TaxID=1191734 RepID=UPI000D55673B|nr:hypothetical protein [Aquimarina aquimarini]